MKKIRNLIIAFLILALLVGGYFLALKLTKEPEPEELAEEIVAEEFDRSLLEKIEYFYAGEEISLSHEGESWIFSPKPALPIVQSTVETMAETASKVVADRLVASVNDDLSEFGFEEETLAVSFTLAGGEKKTYTFGEINQMTGGYYFRTDEGENVYLVPSSVLSAFTKRTVDLIKLDEIPAVDTSNLLSASLSLPGKEPVALTRLAEGYTGYHTQYSCFSVKGDKEKTPADSALGDQFFSLIASLSLKNYYDYAPDAETEASYGLGADKKALLKVDYAELLDSSTEEDTITQTVTRSFTLEIGSQTPDGGVYARLGDSDMICSINAADSDLLLSYADADLSSRDIFGLDFESVGKLTLSFGGEQYTVSYRDNEDDYFFENEDESKSRNAEVDAFSAFYQALTELKAERIDDSLAAGEEVLRFGADLVNDDGTANGNVTLSLSRIGEEGYLASFDGHTGLFCAADAVTPIFTKLEEILK